MNGSFELTCKWTNYFEMHMTFKEFWKHLHDNIVKGTDLE